MSEADRYPIALAALEQLSKGEAPRPLTPFSIGPAVLRPAPARSAPARPEPTGTDTPGEIDPGELVEMMLVGSEEAGSGHPEVHLVFRSEVLGGLHLILAKEPSGMTARFLVEDTAARRAVAAHVDDLVAHLRARGFAIVSHVIEVAAG